MNEAFIYLHLADGTAAMFNVHHIAFVRHLPNVYRVDRQPLFSEVVMASGRSNDVIETIEEIAKLLLSVNK